MPTLHGRTIFVTGASRGIGRAIALRLAREGANIVIAAKSAEPHPKLPGTIFSVAREVEEAGGRALPVQTDIRSEAEVEAAVREAVRTFGGIDVLINNASAIALLGTLDVPMKRFDLMHQINARGTFLCSQKCLPHLLDGQNPHILNLAPPLNLDPKWFGEHLAYTMAKYGMSMCVLGMAREFSGRVAVNALWPRTAIATAAIDHILGTAELRARCRTADIVADAAYHILLEDGSTCSGNFFIDEDVLRSHGTTDLDRYRVEPSSDALLPDFFL